MSETYNWNEPYTDQGMTIPSYMMCGLERYVERGVKPGHFLQKVISNDLAGAVSHADSSNIELLPVYVRFLYNQCPSDCWGSKELMKAWCTQGGLYREG